jgi:type I restriction-modification system specificity subunit
MNTEEENKTSNPSSKIKNEIECTIGSICSRFSSGKGITAEKISPTGEYPVYGGNGVRGYTDNYNFEGQCVVIGRQGANCGNVKYFEGKAYMSEHAIVGVTHQEHDNRYFAYKLSMLNLGRFSGQAAQPGLSVAKLKTLKMTMPNFNIQYRIASILSAYDHLIENNTRRIRLLEQMAENLYKEWFVRFRFPEHEKVEMVNGLPKGWERTKLIKNIKTSSGGTPSRNKGEYYKNGTIPWIKTGELQDCILINTEECITEDAVNNSSAKLFPKGTLLMAMYGVNVGKLGISEIEATCNQACCVFTPKQIDYKYYLFHYLKSIREYLLSISFGAAQQNLSQELIKSIRVLFPDEKTNISFVKEVEPLFKEISIIQQQNQLLTRQRDLLLPRLMSGKLEVKS